MQAEGLYGSKQLVEADLKLNHALRLVYAPAWIPRRLIWKIRISRRKPLRSKALSQHISIQLRQKLPIYGRPAGPQLMKIREIYKGTKIKLLFANLQPWICLQRQHETRGFMTLLSIIIYRQ